MPLGQGNVKRAWVIGVDIIDPDGEPANYEGPLTLIPPAGHDMREATVEEKDSFPNGVDAERALVIWRTDNVATADEVEFGFGGDKIHGEDVDIQVTTFTWVFTEPNVASANVSVLGSLPKP